MAEQLQLFLNAIMFFTRIPVSRWIRYQPDTLNRASRYFPLVGWLVGGVGAGVFFLARLLFPQELAIALSMAATILMTGAFHEDGLADTCDGFGGGWQAERIMEIMKDSRLGTFGAVGLLLTLGIKWLSLKNLPEPLVIPALLVAHPSSRWAACLVIRFGTYARADLQSKAKPLATRIGTSDLFWASLFGLTPFLIYPDSRAWFCLLPLLAITWYLKHWFHKWISGYTGDNLGTVQQLGELTVYLTLLVWV